MPVEIQYTSLITTDKVEPYRNYATGTSTRRIDTVRYAFKVIM